jgi:uncharacterized membrane protein required for colicin V production
MRNRKDMTVQFRPRRRTDTKLIPTLLIGALGIAGIVALFLLVPGVQFIELVLLAIVVGIVAMGYRRGIIRGIISILFLYIATGTAATFYPIPAPYISGIRDMFAGSLVGGRLDVANVTVDGDSLATSFILLMLVVWIVLEAIGHSASPDTSLPRLGILDNLAGIGVHLIVGVLVASLLFNAIGYGHLRRTHHKAVFRSRFNQVLTLHYGTQSFWFGESPPPIYVYDLDVPVER